MFNFLKREKRQDIPDSYTDAVVRAVEASVTGKVQVDALQTAAAEICAGLWSRAFASATVEPATLATRAVTPDVLSMIGRSLIASGESCFELRIEGGALRACPVSSFAITGGMDPTGWIYELTIPGPSRSTVKRVRSEAVMHFRYGVSPREPWRGVSPLRRASETSTLLGNMERRLREETGGVVGHVIPTPSANPNDEYSDLKGDLKALAGNFALVPSMTDGGWSDPGRGNSPKSDWAVQRLGANPPQTIDMLRSNAALHVLAACGVPLTLLEKADGTAMREAWRQFLHGSVAPVARCVEQELADKLNVRVGLNFDSLFASDLSGRARAFQSMVGGGMDIEKAAALAGLMEHADV